MFSTQKESDQARRARILAELRESAPPLELVAVRTSLETWDIPLETFLAMAEAPHAFEPGRSTRFSLGPLCAVCDYSPAHRLHR